jgi:hypothetical protein
MSVRVGVKKVPKTTLFLGETLILGSDSWMKYRHSSTPVANFFKNVLQKTVFVLQKTKPRPKTRTLKARGLYEKVFQSRVPTPATLGAPLFWGFRHSKNTRHVHTLLFSTSPRSIH